MSKRQKPATPSMTPPTTATPKRPGYTKRTNRKDIPKQVINELWARAAGRCEFHGCNELLYRDALTGQRHNGATIAHIVAYSPEGPRGHPTRSVELECDIENIMLTCKLHGSLIDNLNHVDFYTEETLKGYKIQHETRIIQATAAVDDQKTSLLLIQGRINGEKSFIRDGEVASAIRPRWPGSEKNTTIDLNDHVLGEDHQAYWETCTAQIKDSVDSLLRKRTGYSPPQHLSVFALAPIPLLTFLGFKLTSRIDLDLFQHRRHKPSEKWCWDAENTGPENVLKIRHPGEWPEDTRDVAIMVSMTSLIDPDAVTRAVGVSHVQFELRAPKPGPDFLKFRSQISDFQAEMMDILTIIRDRFRRVERLHFFLATPAPIAIKAGQCLIEKADSEVLIYEYKKPNYSAVMTINKKSHVAGEKAHA
ncbi:SAVED domain-containing protein [Deinococcus altitudinis]|uniref:SAVED domain-containing protein n=1 Tax=Deinococcus altitudinis TaxID=468914 RepID=UPI00389290CC